jgi:flagellar hook assembly protein FlgD
LRVVVNQEADGIVTVRVLGPGGNEVRRLYDGPLEEGWWAFTWDGILENGHPAAPGVYRIEVGGASGVKSQEVEISTK